ncbi:MAG: hypothetical protein A4E48_00232 [Methanosaeta sp. PtaU1.Bin060]|nr:MAG: hypothetical protein A4E48_00232 [Methanosaeta sp. PtaU1.Bin060]
MSLNEAAKLSRRLGAIIQYLPPGRSTFEFIRRVGRAASFEELTQQDQKLIERLESQALVDEWVDLKKLGPMVD